MNQCLISLPLTTHYKMWDYEAKSSSTALLGNTVRTRVHKVWSYHQASQHQSMFRNYLRNERQIQPQHENVLCFTFFYNTAPPEILLHFAEVMNDHGIFLKAEGDSTSLPTTTIACRAMKEAKRQRERRIWLLLFCALTIWFAVTTTYHTEQPVNSLPSAARQNELLFCALKPLLWHMNDLAVKSQSHMGWIWIPLLPPVCIKSFIHTQTMPRTTHTNIFCVSAKLKCLLTHAQVTRKTRGQTIESIVEGHRKRAGEDAWWVCVMPSPDIAGTEKPTAAIGNKTFSSNDVTRLSKETALSIDLLLTGRTMSNW